MIVLLRGLTMIDISYDKITIHYKGFSNKDFDILLCAASILRTIFDDPINLDSYNIFGANYWYKIYWYIPVRP